MSLIDFVNKKGWLLADGATGTNLFQMGLESGMPPEFWNRDHPDKIQKLYKKTLEAGADLFLTNSFGSNRCRLQLHNAADLSFELSKISAELARNIADKHSEKCFVAGSIGPTGELIEPLGSLTVETAIEIFQEQAEGLKSGGVDLFWVETMSAKEEFLAAAEACNNVGLEWCGTMSFDTSGYTMMGLSPSDFVEYVKNIRLKPTAIGANCGTGVGELLQSVLQLTDSEPHELIIAKGNAGIPEFINNHFHYDGTPEVMATYAEYARNAGAKIIGGCCGTTPNHLRMMKSRLESTQIRAKPTISELVEVFGTVPVKSINQVTNVQSGESRRRRKRKQ